MGSGPGEPGMGRYKDPQTGAALGTSAWQQFINRQQNNPAFQATGARPSYPNLESWYVNTAIGGGAGSGPMGGIRQQSSGGGGGGRGGRGGGGGGGNPGLNQSAIDWWAKQLGSWKPQQQQFQNYTPPEYQSFTPQAFDTSMYDTARNSLGTAVAGDLATARQATGNMDAYLQQNFRNAYANMPQQQASGLGPLMSLLSGQGVDATANPMMQQAAQGAGAANQAFSNLWSTLGANENQAQQNRLTANQQYGQDAQNRINAQNLGLGAGIDIARGNAQQQYNQWAQQLAYQDWTARQQAAQQAALANWQGLNQTNQNNVGMMNDWYGQGLQSLLGLLGQNAPGTTMPDFASIMGLVA